MIRVGLIGCGFMGSMHANCYKVLDGVTVVAVADVRRERAEELAALSGAEIYADGMSLIEKCELDVIDICLPTYLHASHAEAAMRKAKYVFIEKPVTLTEKEGERLLEVQRETGAGVQVGQVIRFWDEYVYLKGVIDSGVYGKPKNAFFSRLSPRPNWAWEGWIHDCEKSGGALQDLHIHDIDFMLYAFGKPNGFSSVHTDDAAEKMSYVMTVCDYGELKVSVEGGWDFPESYPFSAGYTVKFEKAVLELGSTGLKLYENGECRDVVMEKLGLSASGGGNISDLGGYYNELKYFTDCVKEGKMPEMATLSDAVESVKFVRAEARA